jgi:preprotein translocase subunit Sss1
MSKDEAVLVLLDRTQKYFISVILIAGIGFGLLFLISYIVDVIKKRKIR